MAYSKIIVISLLTLLFASVFFQSFEAKFYVLIKRDELIANFKRIFAPSSDESVTTWTGTEIKPKYIFRPESLEDIKDIVRNADEGGKKIRCIGTQIKTIEQALLKNNPPLTFESMTYQNMFSASGVVAVGCHGAKTGGPSVSDLVVKLQIVTGDGKLKEFSNEEDSEEMNVARLNLGLLGVIYSITFRVEPLFNLHAYDIILPLKSWLKPENIKEKFDHSDSLIVIYLPFNQGKSDTSNDEIRIKQFNPELTPIVKGLQWETLKKSIKNLTLIATEALHYRSNIESVQGHDVSFALKADPDFTNVATEFSFLINKIAEYAEQGKFPINVYTLIRMIRASSALLSPVYDNDPNAIYCFLEFSSLKGTRHYPEFFKEITARWISKYQTSPHWAKDWESAPGVKEFLHTKLSDRLARFEKIRAKYDPKKKFFDNETLKKVFNG
ncbi:6038_t:CDS:2 [Ambispora gerdemannii]|uniref:6038_t:CDS:1 n=1 Tax=Ambispora gerdemannii TaxID=144530 RepID=A0A9N9CQY8_9GLOM|nr:6038_t:CDS:2 [Ambispora gerdemannii]